jgi:hypothetical protein
MSVVLPPPARSRYLPAHRCVWSAAVTLSIPLKVTPITRTHTSVDYREGLRTNPRGEVDLSTSTAVLSVVDVPPLPGTEGRLIQKLFLVVATGLSGSRLLSMPLLFVPQWGGDHLTR